MLSTGNIRPERSMTGIISPIPDTSMAATWVFTTLEISSPSDNARKINITDTKNSRDRLPAIGTPRTYTERRSMVIRFTSDSVKYGVTLERIIYIGLIGETRRISIVPFSFSRTMLTEVIMETLAIIAYKSPVTKAEIEKIRGVKSDHAVNKLIEYGLVEETGRLNAPGRPALFAPTDEFYSRFDLKDKDSLPKPGPELEAEIDEEVKAELQSFEESEKSAETIEMET